MTRPATATLALFAAAVGLVGCGDMLDQNRTPANYPRPAAPTTGPAVATGDLGTPQPLPGLMPPPKPFVDTARFSPSAPVGAPSTLLQLHQSPTAPVPLAAYDRQPDYAVDDFDLGPALTAAVVRRRFGPPAGVAGIDDPWFVYRLTGNREMWLHFANDGTGLLVAADLVRGAESGYVRDRLYPTP